MTATYSDAELKSRYEKLPEALKDAVFDVDVAENIFETGKKHGLTIEKIGFLGEEVGYMILGLTPPNEFAPHLKKRLEIEEGKAKSIAAEINHRIFFPLREALKETHQIEITEEAIQKGEPLPRPAPATPSVMPHMPKGEEPKPPVEEKPKTIEEERKEAVWKMMSKSVEKPAPPPQPVALPPSKIPPIDLRKTGTFVAPEKPAAPREAHKPSSGAPPVTRADAQTEMISGGRGIFAAPPEKPKPAPEPPRPPVPPQNTQEKKPLSGGADPYREPIE